MSVVAPRQFFSTGMLPGAGLPHDRASRMAARRAFVDLKLVFLAAVDALGQEAGDWLHNQIRLLPAWVENHIVCRSIHNEATFPLPNIHCLKRDSMAWYLWTKAAWGLGFGQYNGYMG